MKHIILLCDGMADRPCPQLQDQTPMQVADKPAMDALAAMGQIGLVKTVPDGMTPGSDVANLSVLGYDVRQCYTGRSPLEAANIGIDLADDDMALRCNLVTLSEQDDYFGKSMADYCADDIGTEQADAIIQTLQQHLGGGEFDFHTGTAYRHCLVWHHAPDDIGKLTPPHDIPGQPVASHLPQCQPLLDLMRRSVEILKDHPVNQQRMQSGHRPANAIWLWGQGRRPQLQPFTERYGKNGAMVSAVDLLKGIARLSGMRVCEVEGATGYIDTNFDGKMQAAYDALANGCDFVYIHVEAPDECGHRGEVQNKVRAIEEIDRRILRPLLEKLPALGDFSILILPDHPTPLSIRTHAADPVPYLLYRSNAPVSSGVTKWSEQSACAFAQTDAADLMQQFLANA